MDSQTEDVIVMAHVEALGVLLSVVHDPYGSHVVHDLTRLGVEQVAPAIITPVAAKQNKTKRCKCIQSWNGCSTTRSVSEPRALLKPTHE